MALKNFADQGNLEEQGEALEYGAIKIASSRAGGDLWGHLSVDKSAAVQFLHNQAIENLPPNTRYELRRREPGNYGRTLGLAWYRIASMDAEPTWGHVPSEPTRGLAGGYWLIGQFITPGKFLDETKPMPTLVRA